MKGLLGVFPPGLAQASHCAGEISEMLWSTFTTWVSVGAGVPVLDASDVPSWRVSGVALLSSIGSFVGRLTLKIPVHPYWALD